jgi:ABC-type bacteriocin/lantibiotic exporter with double-glycine peptidase domain
MSGFSTIYSFLNKAEKNKVLILLFFIIITTFLEVLSISLILPLVQLISKNHSEFTSKNILENFITANNDNIILVICFMIILAFLLKNLLIFIFNYYQLKFSKDVNFRIKKELLNTYFSKDLQYFFTNDKNIGFILRNLGLVNIVSTALNSYLNLLVEFSIFAALTAYLFFINFESALILTIYFFLIFYGLYKFSKKKLYTLSQINQDIQGEANKIIIDTFSWIRTVKIYLKENYFLKNINILNLRFFESMFKIELLQQLPRLVIEFAIILFFCIFIIIMNIFLKKDLSDIFAILIVYAAIVFRLLPTFTKINSSFQRIKSYEPNIKLLKKEYQKTDSQIIFNKPNFLSNFEKIEFKNINFNYTNQKKIIIKNFNLIINKNEIIGISGNSGSGKSTLLNILCGLLLPTTGQILINNQINSFKEVRIKFGYVSQDSQIFDDSLWNNITLFDDKNSENMKNFLYVMKQTNLLEVFEKNNNFEDTYLGQRGTQISGGQSQRINIARALYYNPDILLFDECTNALDDENEKKIIDMILNLRKTKTILISSHNKNHLNMCDKIYSL